MVNSLCNHCPICGKDDGREVMHSENEVLARYGFKKRKVNDNNKLNLSINLIYCDHCTFAWNSNFTYKNVNYESNNIIESAKFSTKYIEYQRNTAKRINSLLKFKPNTMVEIGAGGGIFIEEFDAIRRIAIEPSSESNSIDKNNIEVYKQYYHKKDFNFSADIVVMRQVLEHIPKPVEFLQDVLESFCHSDRFNLYIEVPNSMLSFENARFYDVYYEHCNYFTMNCLYKISEILKLKVIDAQVSMDGELISVLLTKKRFEHDLSVNFAKKASEFASLLSDFRKQGKRVFGWGAAGNGVQIIHKLKLTEEDLAYVIDSDINKQNMFLPVTLHKIISPNDAVHLKPDVILVFTQFHKAEIADTCNRLFPNIPVIFPA